MTLISSGHPLDKVKVSVQTGRAVALGLFLTYAARVINFTEIAC
jgi:hypothetical protein